MTMEIEPPHDKKDQKEEDLQEKERMTTNLVETYQIHMKKLLIKKEDYQHQSNKNQKKKAWKMK